MSLSHAYEATETDVLDVMRASGLEPTMEEAEAVFAAHVSPRLGEVARAALHGDKLDEQTEAANGMIREILAEAGVIPSAPAP